MHVVVAMPRRASGPLDPHWYTLAFSQYIQDMLPADGYTVSSYFVTLKNIPRFLDDMLKMRSEHPDLCVLNVCDGAEWDGYPGISVVKAWEDHPVNGLIKMSGADSQFVLNSDDKTVMQSHLKRAGLPALPQVMVPYDSFEVQNFSTIIARSGLNDHWPLFCKLNIGAAATGISPASICHNLEELEKQLKNLHKQYPKTDLLVQPFLSGFEYTVLVVSDKVYAAVRRDYHNPSNLMAEDYLIDAKDNVADQITFHPAPKQVQQLALDAIKAIPGKHHYTRVDIRADGNGNIYVIDINDRPGLGNPSSVKCMLDFNHIPESQLVQDILATCVF